VCPVSFIWGVGWELRNNISAKYSKTCLKWTPYIPETWTNGK